jgi:putative gatB/yqey family protein
MTSFKEQVHTRLVDAIRTQDELQKQVWRSVLADFESAETSGKTRATLTREQELRVLRSAVNRRQETSGIFVAAGHIEKAQQETTEANLITSILPETLDKTGIRALVKDIITETGAEGQRGIGIIMGRLKNREDVDPKLAAVVAREELLPVVEKD